MRLRVTEVLADVGIIDTSASYYTEEARDRGTYVHEATVLMDENDLDPESPGLDHPKVQERIEGYRNWREDQGQDFVILGRELEVVHPRLDYVGHLDIEARDEKHKAIAVIDIKPPGYVWWHGIQLAAYGQAIRDAGLEVSMTGLPCRITRYVLHLGGGGRNYKLVPKTGTRDWNVFHAALIVAQAKREAKK